MVNYLLDLTMHLFFQSQGLQLLIFDMDDQEFLVILDYVLLCFILKCNQN